MPGPEARVLSPPGRGALAAIALGGDGAGELLRRALDRPPPPPGRLGVRTLRRPNGARIDEVVVAARRGGVYEITGHAGPAVTRASLALLEEAGASVGPAGPAGLLACARTRLAARVLSWVERGRLDPNAEPARRIVERLSRPARVAIVGPPNAGKSTLFNALLDRERAITSERAGTTRDVLTEDAALAGVPVHLSDTAGLGGPDEDALGALAAGRARAAFGGADLALLVLDGAAPIPPGWEAEASAASGPARLVVLTKADLPPALAPGRGGVPASAIRVSAARGEGLGALAALAARALLGADPESLTDPSAIASPTSRGETRG